METKPQPTVFFDIFQNTEDFLHHLNPKNCSPPFITSVFGPKRKESFKSVRKMCLTKNENMCFFISKFELEYVEILRSKLREHYINFILQKKYEVPEDVNIKEVEGYGAISELAQLAVSIAEWALEIEICAYTLEGLEIYGLVKPNSEKQEDYLKILKKEYSFKPKGMITATTEYALRRGLSFAFGKAASLVAAKGMNRGGVDGILEIAFNILNLREFTMGTLHSITSSLDLTWVIGGLVFSHLIQMLNDYAIKRQVLNNMTHIKEIFESNTLHLINQRKIIISILEKGVNEQDKNKCKQNMGVLLEAVNEMLNPPNHPDGKVKNSSESETKDEAFRIKEEGDVVIVEEGNFEEKTDKSGVTVIEF